MVLARSHPIGPRSVANLGLLVLTWLSVSSCATYTQDTKEMRNSYRVDAFDRSLTHLEDLGLQDQSRNKLLYLWEKSMILDRMKKLKESRDLLKNSDLLVDQMRNSSVVGDLASFVYNDSAKDYQGEDYEKVALHLMLAVSFLEEGRLSEARVAARAINTTLQEINNFYKENKNRYRDDAFARYLSGAIFEAKGEVDNAIVAYRKSLKSYENDYGRYFATSPPQSLIKSLVALLRKRGRTQLAGELVKRYDHLSFNRDRSKSATLFVVHEVDTIAIKTTQEFVFFWDRKPIRFSFPVIRRRGYSYYGGTGVTVDGEYTRGEVAQNLNAIAAQTLEDSKGRYMAKMVSRVIVKDQISQQARGMFGGLGELFVSIYGAFTETADTRSWSLLPGAFYVTRLDLKPGKHQIKVKTNGDPKKNRTINLEAGEIRFIRDRS